MGLTWMRHRRGERAARLAEAEAAVARARTAHREATERRPEVHAVAERLRRLREQNHFAEMISRALQGGD
jgi:hypothetical protein